MTIDDVFLTEINQEIKIGPAFGIQPGKYHVTSSLVWRKKNKLFILGYLIVQNEDVVFAAARQT